LRYHPSLLLRCDNGKRAAKAATPSVSSSPGPRLAANFYPEGGDVKLLRPLLFFPLAKLALFSLKREHFPLRRFHETVAQRLSYLSGHVTHPVNTDSILKRWNPGKARDRKITE